MQKIDVVQHILAKKLHTGVQLQEVKAFAPSNIALCKYWGKRDRELNLPLTASLSISLGIKGTTTAIKMHDGPQDIIVLNNRPVEENTEFYQRLLAFLDLFRLNHKPCFSINTQSNFPTAAGLASSASGFAALTMALDKLFNWGLSLKELSILARLGSGSACRSICDGFVEWQEGTRDDGMDSYGLPIEEKWPDLCIGLLVISAKEKDLSSREAMQRTLETSPFYSLWPEKVASDLSILKQAIKDKNHELLGKTAESNAIAMHATMLSAWPPICYFLSETIIAMQKVWELRKQGIPVYFTEDAGPNLKLLFLKSNAEIINTHFPTIEILEPFGANRIP